MYRFIKDIKASNDGDLSSVLDRELIRYREFVKYSHNKMQKYDSAMENTLQDLNYQLSTIDLNSIKAYEKTKIKALKKKCNEALFWFTKSKDLMATICNYESMSKYEERDVIQFKNATQTLRLISFKNLQSEYKAGDLLENIQAEIMNLGYDTNRNLKIVCSIKNKDLAIDILSETNISIEIERMETVTVELSSIESPKQQCKAYFIIEIYNENNEIISSQSIKEIFFRKEGN